MDSINAEGRIQEQVLIAQVDNAIKQLETSENKLIEAEFKNFLQERKLIQLRFKVQRDKLLKTLEEVLVLVTTLNFYFHLGTVHSHLSLKDLFSTNI
jgi:hypothetical protein